MKPIKILKKLIVVYYYLVGIGICLDLFRWLLAIANSTPINLSYLENQELYPPTDINVVVVKLFRLFLLIAFFYAIALLKRSSKELSAGKDFENQIIFDFKLIGKLFIFCAMAEIIGKVIITLVFVNTFNFKPDTSMLLLPVIGMFFMYLSEVFAKAKSLQSENELTI